MKIIKVFAIIRNMPEIQNNTTIPSKFKSNPLLRHLGAGLLGLTAATAGHLATDYVSEGSKAMEDRQKAVSLLSNIVDEDTLMLLNQRITAENKTGLGLEGAVLDNKIGQNLTTTERRKQIGELSLSISQDDGFNYLAAVVGLTTGLITALVAGKKLKAEQVVGNFKELCHALVQTSKDGEFNTLEGSYKINFKDLFRSTIQELINDPLSKNKKVKLAFFEHKRFFMQMFRNLADQGKADDASLIVKNMAYFGISKADILTVLESMKSTPNKASESSLAYPQRRDFLDSISGLLDRVDYHGYLLHPGIERLRKDGVQTEETYY